MPPSIQEFKSLKIPPTTDMCSSFEVPIGTTKVSLWLYPKDPIPFSYEIMTNDSLIEKGRGTLHGSIPQLVVFNCEIKDLKEDLKISIKNLDENKIVDFSISCLFQNAENSKEK